MSLSDLAPKHCSTPGHQDRPAHGIRIGGEDDGIAWCRDCCPPPVNPRPPTAAQVTEMVDETAKAEMRRQGRDPEAWDRLPGEMRDQLRLLALDRLRKLP